MFNSSKIGIMKVVLWKFKFRFVEYVSYLNVFEILYIMYYAFTSSFSS